MNKKNLILDILKLAIAAAIVVFTVLNFDRLSNLDVRELVAGAASVFAAALTVLGVYLLKSAVMIIPASMIYISVGMAFDTAAALTINLLGILIEVTATYFLGKFLGKSTVEKIISDSKAGQRLLSVKDGNKNRALLAIRFLPVFPIDFSSLFLGAFDYRFLPYLLISMLGISPRVIVFTIVGDKIYDLIPMKYVLAAIVIIVPIAVVAAIIKTRMSKKKSSDQ